MQLSLTCINMLKKIICVNQISPHIVNVTKKIQSLYSALLYAWIKDSSVLSRHAGSYLTTNAGNRLKTTIIFFFLFFFTFFLTFSASGTGPEAGYAGERDGAQKPPLVESGHVSDPGWAWSAQGKLSSTLRADVPVRFCACVCVCVRERESARLVGDFRLITTTLTAFYKWK